MGKRPSIFLLLIGSCLIGCAPNTVVEAVNLQSAGGYRLRNDKVEAIVSPELRRVVSFRRIGGDNVFVDEVSKQESQPPDDLLSSPKYRVISASDGKLIVESREQRSISVIVRRVYRLVDEELIIETTMKPAREVTSQ